MHVPGPVRARAPETRAALHYQSWTEIGDVFLPGCCARWRLKGLNREGTKASEPEGGGEWMSRWDDNAAWHLWNESLVTMASKRDGTVSQEPQIKPAVNDVWLVFRRCSKHAAGEWCTGSSGGDLAPTHQMRRGVDQTAPNFWMQGITKLDLGVSRCVSWCCGTNCKT